MWLRRGLRSKLPAPQSWRSLSSESDENWQLLTVLQLMTCHQVYHSLDIQATRRGVPRSTVLSDYGAACLSGREHMTWSIYLPTRPGRALSVCVLKALPLRPLYTKIYFVSLVCTYYCVLACVFSFPRRGISRLLTMTELTGSALRTSCA